MGIDIQKLSSKEHLDKLDQNSVLEILEDIPESLIQFSANPILNYCLEKKFGLKDKPSPRVLNNWVKNGLVKVDENDKGKVKRFDRLESIWLNIVVELRDFGLPLDSIARTRKILFDYQLKGFSLFKFQVLNCILRKPQTLVVYKNGIKIFNDIISFDQDYYPSLEKDYYNSNEKLNFNRNDTSYEIDTTILTQLYDSIALNDKNTYSKPYKSNKLIKTSRFSKKEIEHYYSIQNELPSIYGLKEFEISSSSSSERKSQVNQLKGYLLLMEQIMANYLSQLVSVRNLFSIKVEKDHINTFFNQVPTNITELQKVIGKDNSSFLSFLNSISESDKTLTYRKNSIVDHLLSRFGETYETSLITKLNKSIYDYLSCLLYTSDAADE